MLTLYIYRGKDFYRHFRAHPEKLDELAPEKPDQNIEERIKAAGSALLRYHYIYRSDRLNNKPKPGRKLLKFPKKTVIHPVQEFVEDGFYTWIYEKPRKVLNAILSIGLVVFTISCCLLPVAPNIIKIIVFYASLTMFSLLIGLLILRLVLFGVSWLVLGVHFWLLPNVMSDELPVVEAFKPLYSLDKDAKKPDILSRLVALGGAGMVFWALYRTGPDGASVRQATQRAHDDLLEFFNLAAPKQLSANQTGTAGGESATPGGFATGESSVPNEEL